MSDLSEFFPPYALPAEERELFAPSGSFTGWPDAEPSAPSSDNGYCGQRGLQWPNH